MTETKRCVWADAPQIMTDYHDTEWGVPKHDDQVLFEMLNLEGAQAGLSWLTILRKRDEYRKAFDQFDAKKISQYSDKKREALLQNAGIIRNRLKVSAFIENAKAFLRIQGECGSFDAYLWQFVGGAPLTHRQQEKGQQIAVAMSKQLKKDGFRFMGPTVCFAFMQATGMINDHEKGCFRSKLVKSPA